MNEIAKIYINQGYDFSIVTSAKNLINSLKRKNEWCLYRYSKSKRVFKETSKIDRNRKIRDSVYTAALMYIK